MRDKKRSMKGDVTMSQVMISALFVIAIIVGLSWAFFGDINNQSSNSGLIGSYGITSPENFNIYDNTTQISQIGAGLQNNISQSNPQIQSVSNIFDLGTFFFFGVQSVVYTIPGTVLGLFNQMFVDLGNQFGVPPWFFGIVTAIISIFFVMFILNVLFRRIPGGTF